ncbi:hypothetical protein [Streptomyces sp. NPDC102462]|uniref:hypothetical protein n=1 Tax=Streptomyces sp. NPDC102462 TaxID=3366178 RepID=UPI0037FA670E
MPGPAAGACPPPGGRPEATRRILSDRPEHSDSAKRLRRRIRELKEPRTADAEETAQLTTDTEALVGVPHPSMTADRPLRRQFADHTTVVRTPPTSSHPCQGQRPPAATRLLAMPFLLIDAAAF